MWGFMIEPKRVKMRKAFLGFLIEVFGTVGLVYVLNPIFKAQGYGLFEWIVFIFSLRMAIPYWYENK